MCDEKFFSLVIPLLTPEKIELTAASAAVPQWADWTGSAHTKTLTAGCLSVCLLDFTVVVLQHRL